MLRIFRFFNALVPAVCMLFAAGRQVAAQTLHGTLTETGSGRAVAGAAIRLLDTSGRTVASTNTDVSGIWQIAGPLATATYTLRAEKAGYGIVVTTPFRLESGVSLEFNLSTRKEVVQLEGVSRQAMNYAGFRRRLETERMGVLMDRAAVQQRIDKLGANDSRRILEALIAGLRVEPGTGGLLLPYHPTPDQRGIRWGPGGPACFANVLIDGALYRPPPPGGTDPRFLVELKDIRGIEIYIYAESIPVSLVPPDFRPQCGLIAIWTAEGLGID